MCSTAKYLRRSRRFARRHRKPTPGSKRPEFGGAYSAVQRKSSVLSLAGSTAACSVIETPDGDVLTTRYWPAGKFARNHGPSEVASSTALPLLSLIATLTLLMKAPDLRANTSLRSYFCK